MGYGKGLPILDMVGADALNVTYPRHQPPFNVYTPGIPGQ